MDWGTWMDGRSVVELVLLLIARLLLTDIDIGMGIDETSGGQGLVIVDEVAEEGCTLTTEVWRL